MFPCYDRKGQPLLDCTGELPLVCWWPRWVCGFAVICIAPDLRVWACRVGNALVIDRIAL